jgi:hypothetical protein
MQLKISELDPRQMNQPGRAGLTTIAACPPSPASHTAKPEAMATDTEEPLLNGTGVGMLGRQYKMKPRKTSY